MRVVFFQIDSFTNEPFRGNPAAVCVYPGEKDAQWMQDVAAEMNLSETAFVQPRTDGSYELRWFTPVCEVDLCGHATLAAAHALFETGIQPADQHVRFHTRSGVLAAVKREDRIELDFPAVPAQPAKVTKSLERALGVTPVAVFSHRFGTLAELDSADMVRGLAPKFTALAKAGGDMHIVTAGGGDDVGYDFVSRVFCPRLGIDEDPVTGAAHCCLGPFWKDKTGKDDFIAHQASRRGGVVRVGVRGERVTLAGQAVTVVRGEVV